MKLRCLPDEPAGEPVFTAWLLISKRLFQSDEPTGDNWDFSNDESGRKDLLGQSPAAPRRKVRGKSIPVLRLFFQRLYFGGIKRMARRSIRAVEGFSGEVMVSCPRPR